MKYNFVDQIVKGKIGRAEAHQIIDDYFNELENSKTQTMNFSGAKGGAFVTPGKSDGLALWYGKTQDDVMNE